MTTTATHDRDAATMTLLRCGTLGAPLFVGVFLLVGATRSHYSPSPGLVAHGGLFQRLTIVIGLTWLTLLARRSTGKSVG